MAPLAPIDMKSFSSMLISSLAIAIAKVLVVCNSSDASFAVVSAGWNTKDSAEAFIASGNGGFVSARFGKKHNTQKVPQPQSRQRIQISTTKLHDLPRGSYDNLLSGLAEITLGLNLGVLGSELSIIQTGCGPIGLSDNLERICYQGTLIAAAVSVFVRSVYFFSGVIEDGGVANEKGFDTGGLTTYLLENYFSSSFRELRSSTIIQMRLAEYVSLFAVLGALVALAVQISRGEQMDGLSGINVDLCRAIRDL